jgi:hypothetical protein
MAPVSKDKGKDDTPGSRRKRIEEMQASSGSGSAAPVSPPGNTALSTHVCSLYCV